MITPERPEMIETFSRRQENAEVTTISESPGAIMADSMPGLANIVLSP
jgi:hypothetical protein